MKGTVINLDQVTMHVISTAETGVVNEDTIFHFTQHDEHVEASYSGGQIVKGFLVGIMKGQELAFTYCQLQKDQQLDNGVSQAELRMDSDGKILLVEHFEWKSRPGEKGTNTFRQITD